MIRLNDNPIQKKAMFGQPSIADYPLNNFKNITYSKSKKLMNPYCKKIVDAMMDLSEFKSRKYNYVFIKYSNLVKNAIPTNGLWHLDSSLNAEHEYENFLFVTGKASLTEFIHTPIEIEKQKNSIEFHNEINRHYFSSSKIESGIIHKYNELNVHRVTKSLFSESRLLIRLSNTNKQLMQY